MGNIRICAVMQAPPALAYVWLPDIIFGSFLFVLAARIGFKRGRFGFNIFRMERKDLLDALVYGNVHYFFCILVANVVNTGIWQGLGSSWFEAPEGFAAVIEIVLGCRMVLDLQSAVADSEGLQLLDSFPLRDSFGAREGPVTLYSAVSTYDLEVLGLGKALAHSSRKQTRHVAVRFLLFSASVQNHFCRNLSLSTNIPHRLFGVFLYCTSSISDSKASRCSKPEFSICLELCTMRNVTACFVDHPLPIIGQVLFLLVVRDSVPRAELLTSWI
ncbi:hypothetical protein BDR05DRAFT_330507 [Suillus weaverae]|nr:hypothetical protein BDR05DRAFT_330507 [Suillus weaverae]